MTRSVLIPALAALALASFATPAPAQETYVVSYGDLDIASPAGRTVLIQRVSSAVERVCGDSDVRNLHSGKAVKACRTETWQTVQPQLAAVLSASVRVLADATITVGQARGSR
jgi:UrcA family protein